MTSTLKNISVAAGSILAVSSIVVMTVSGINYIEKDPVAMQKVIEIEQEIAMYEQQLEDERRKQLELLREQNKWHERAINEQRQSTPPSQSYPPPHGYPQPQSYPPPPRYPQPQNYPPRY